MEKRSVLVTSSGRSRSLNTVPAAMQIQYNITRIEEWCKSHDMQENLIQLESLMQATKLLQLKKVRDVA